MIARSALVGLLLIAATAAAQETATLDAFFGRWQGGELSAEAQALALQPGDLDILIEPEDEGFMATWIAVFRTGQPDSPAIQRAEQSMAFEPVEDRPTVFEAEDWESPLEGGTLSWARLHGATLSIYQLSLSDAGGYRLLSHDRTLTPEGMEVTFRHLRNGEPALVVQGRLARSE